MLREVVQSWIVVIGTVAASFPLVTFILYNKHAYNKNTKRVCRNRSFNLQNRAQTGSWRSALHSCRMRNMPGLQYPVGTLALPTVPGFRNDKSKL